MSKTARAVIMVKSNNPAGSLIKEAQATAAQTIQPGDALTLTFPTADLESDPPTAVASATDEQVGNLYLCLEKVAVNPGDAEDSAEDATYTGGDMVRYVVPQAGDIVQVRITSNTSIVKAEILGTNGSTGEDGTFIDFVPDATNIVGTIRLRALQAITGAVAVVPLCLAEVL